MEKTPACVGIILDGNRRWAKERGLPKLEGHKKGYDRLVDVTRMVHSRGVKHFAVYVFSTENWNREQEEVSYLMELVKQMAEERLKELVEENVRVRFIGDLARVAPDVRAALGRIEEASKDKDGITLWVCFSYGGRAEIVAAARETVSAGEDITEESLRKHFWSAEMPDPDIIVRPGGEKRLSNFLLWQAAYSELFFLDTYWPDFSEADLDAILAEFASRERRHGR